MNDPITNLLYYTIAKSIVSQFLRPCRGGKLCINGENAEQRLGKYSQKSGFESAKPLQVHFSVSCANLYPHVKQAAHLASSIELVGGTYIPQSVNV